MTSRRSTWRDTYKVHPAADVFPMMSDEKLAQLGEDIKLNGLASPITVAEKPVPDENGNRRVNGRGEIYIVDGRNRLDALEMIGTDFISRRRYVPLKVDYKLVGYDDATTYVISANIHRRHLTKQRQADLIVAAHAAAAAENKLTQVESVSSSGGRGKKNPLKDAVIADAKAHGISEGTAKRAIAKANPKPKQDACLPPKPKSKSRSAGSTRMGPTTVEGWRRGLHSCVQGRMR
jgi:ParB-like chromosome segregation protein Spo0J